MSFWTFLIAETEDSGSFIESVEGVLEPYSNTVEEETPLADSETRVRLRLGYDLRAPEGVDEKPARTGEQMSRFLAEVITDQVIGPYEWALVVVGNNTTDSGSVEIFRDGKQIDEYEGNTSRLGEDVGAYLERYHGVLIDPRPRKMGWIQSDVYDPKHDLEDHEPAETLAQTEPSPPFEYGAENTWLRVVAETEDTTKFENAIRNYPVTVERREPKRRTENRVRLDFESTFFGSGFGRSKLFNEFEHGEYDVEFAVVISGGERGGDANIFLGNEITDTVSGSREYYGADVEAYLKQYHGLTIDAMPDSNPSTPDDVPLADSHREAIREPLKEHLESL